MFKLDKYGKLVIDKILFETNYPILFTCVNDIQELFLCVCCQNNADGKKWLLTKTDESNIIEMLQDKISIRDAFLKNPESQITVFLKEGIVVGEHNELEWGEESIYLPKKGEYMDSEPGEFEEEIEHYQRRIERKSELQISAPYNKLFANVQTLKNELAIVEELLSTIPEVSYDVINSSIKHRLSVSEKICLESLQEILLPYYFENNITEEVTVTINYSNSTMLEKTVCIINAEGDEDYLVAA